MWGTVVIYVRRWSCEIQNDKSIPFFIGHAIIGFIVRAKSPYNCDKRIYQSMMILYSRDRICYEGVKDTNTKDNQMIKGTKDMYSNISHKFLGWWKGEKI